MLGVADPNAACSWGDDLVEEDFMVGWLMVSLTK